MQSSSLATCIKNKVDFHHLGDQVSSGGASPESIAVRIRIDWAEFKLLLPLLVTKGFSSSQSERQIVFCLYVYSYAGFIAVEHGFMTTEDREA